MTVEGEAFAVTGVAWLDREWSTSSLEPGIVGWDWFALHLSDGGSLMYYRLRTANGEASPFSGGTLVERRRRPNAARRERRGADSRSITGRARQPAFAIRSLGASRVPKSGITLEIASLPRRPGTRSFGALLGGRRPARKVGARPAR